MTDIQPKQPEKSLGELFTDLSNDMSQLVRDEIELVKVEVKAEVSKAGKGGGLVGAGAFAAYMGVVLLSFAAAWGLAARLPEGVAFLIVGLVWAVVAAVLALKGRQELKNVDPVPQATVETLQEDVKWAKDLKS